MAQIKKSKIDQRGSVGRTVAARPVVVDPRDLGRQAQRQNAERQNGQRPPGSCRPIKPPARAMLLQTEREFLLHFCVVL